MKTSTHGRHVAICAALAAIHIGFLVVPGVAAGLYSLAVRPLGYVVLAIWVYVGMGRDMRPVRWAHESNVAAVIATAVFGMGFAAAVLMVGAGANAYAPGPAAVTRNLWERGLVVLLGEYVRFKLIKGAAPQHRLRMAVALAAVIAFCRMDTLRLPISGELAWGAVFFEFIFTPLVASAAASCFAIGGSFASVVLVGFVFTMGPYVLPIMPQVAPLVWSLAVSALAFGAAILCVITTKDSGVAQRLREKRAARYARRPVLGLVSTVSALALAAAFFAGVFPIYPAVVLSDSMQPALSRGSIAFIEKVPPGQAFDRVGEGEVIHFTNRHGVAYIHRVVDFRHGADGGRLYITRGDASDLTDPHPVEQGDVMGIARASLPFAGYPYILYRTVAGALE